MKNYRRNIYGIAILVLGAFLAVTGCRKEIVHQIGKTVLIEKKDTTNTDTTTNSGKEWKMVYSSPTEITCLKTYIGKLYLAGNFSHDYYKGLATFNGTSFSKANGFNGILNGDIEKFEIVLSQLWMVGDFSYFNLSNLETYNDVMSYAFGVVSGIEFGGTINSRILNCTEYRSDLLVSGYFDTNAENVNTKNMELIRFSKTMGFGIGIGNPPIDMKSYDNRLYVCGEHEFGGVKMVGYWDGSSWKSIDRFNRAGILDKGYSLEVYDDGLFLLCDKFFGLTTNVQYFDGSNWYEIAGVSIGSNFPCKLKVVGGDLYLFGKGVQVGDSYVSNVAKYKNGTWENVGSILKEINDLETYNGKLYAATPQGLYTLE